MVIMIIRTKNCIPLFLSQVFGLAGFRSGIVATDTIKLMKGKDPRKHSLHEKTAASVLLKLFISGNE